jgi:hypothetical protein
MNEPTAEAGGQPVNVDDQVVPVPQRRDPGGARQGQIAHPCVSLETINIAGDIARGCPSYNTIVNIT